LRRRRTLTTGRRSRELAAHRLANGVVGRPFGELIDVIVWAANLNRLGH